MSKFEDNTGLRESEKPKFERFQQELAPYFEQLNKIGLLILIWGPGEGTNYYKKRDEIKQFLKAKNSNDEVATSEDLLRQVSHPSQLDIVQAEMLHAGVADVIFGLVTSDPRQSGIYMEVDNLLRFDNLIHKTWLIVPDSRDWKKVDLFIQQPTLKSFPSYRKKSFRTKVLDQCEQVRRFCLDKVAEERGRKMRKYVNDQLSGASVPITATR
jgi:hypothetical protein